MKSLKEMICKKLALGEFCLDKDNNKFEKIRKKRARMLSDFGKCLKSAIKKISESAE